MTYSCCDFTDDILNALEVNVPLESADNPSKQADLALAEIERLQAGVTFDDQETAIVLAALRMIQRIGVQDQEQDVATNGGEFDPLGDDAIDELCERINFGQESTP